MDGSGSNGAWKPRLHPRHSPQRPKRGRLCRSLADRSGSATPPDPTKLLKFILASCLEGQLLARATHYLVAANWCSPVTVLRSVDWRAFERRRRSWWRIPNAPASHPIAGVRNVGRGCPHPAGQMSNRFLESRRVDVDRGGLEPTPGFREFGRLPNCSASRANPGLRCAARVPNPGRERGWCR